MHMNDDTLNYFFIFTVVLLQGRAEIYTGIKLQTLVSAILSMISGNTFSK